MKSFRRQYLFVLIRSVLILLFGTLCLQFSVCASPLSNAHHVVKAEFINSRNQYPAGGRYPVGIRLNITKSWYIHATDNHGATGLVPLSLSFSALPSGITIRDIRFPMPILKRFDSFSHPLELYSGDIIIYATISIDPDLRPDIYEIRGKLFYQACSEKTCIPPDEIFVHSTVRVVKKGAASVWINREFFYNTSRLESKRELFTDGSLTLPFLFTLTGIFLSGLALNLTPCIYPLLPITVSYFGGGSLAGSRYIHAFLYVTGLAITNSMLGLVASLSGGMLGAVLQNPFVLIVISSILFALALSFFGLWELHLPSRITTLASKNFGGYFGSLFMGLTLGIIAAPCIGPFVLGLMTYVGQKGNPWLGFLCFFVLSLGMGLPLVILAVFSGSIKKLPVSGEWMIWVRKLLGWVMVGMAVYVIRPLFPHGNWQTLIFAPVMMAAGVHLGWITPTGRGSSTFAYIKKIAGSILIAGAVVYSFFVIYSAPSLNWRPYSETALKEAATEKRPVIMDFYADWCLPCRELDSRVFNDPSVRKLQGRFVLLRIDLTSRHPGQDMLVGRYKVRGVPTVVFISRQGKEIPELRIESYVDRKEFLRRMKQALNR